MVLALNILVASNHLKITQFVRWPQLQSLDEHSSKLEDANTLKVASSSFQSMINQIVPMCQIQAYREINFGAIE